MPQNAARQRKSKAPPGKPSAKQAAFLAAYAEIGVITHAAEKAGVDRGTHGYWLEHDPGYQARFAEAHEQATDKLEAEARRRAVDGVQIPVYCNGIQVGTQIKYSDRLLERLLGANRPDKFRERASVEHSGPDGGPMQMIADAPQSDQEWIDRYLQVGLPMAQWMPRIQDLYRQQQQKPPAPPAAPTNATDGTTKKASPPTKPPARRKPKPPKRKPAKPRR